MVTVFLFFTKKADAKYNVIKLKERLRLYGLL